MIRPVLANRKSISSVLAISSGGVVLNFLINDLFTTQRAAGSVDGTDAEPGPGTRRVVDSGSNVTINTSTELDVTNTITTWKDPLFYYAALSRVVGRSVCMAINLPTSGERFMIGWRENVSGAEGAINHAVQIYSNNRIRTWNSQPANQVTKVFAYSYDTTYYFVSCLRSVGALLIIKSASNWILLWVQNNLANNPLYPAIQNQQATSDASAVFDMVRVADLVGGLDSDYGIANTRLAGARTAGDTFTHEADVWLEYMVATVPMGTLDIHIRKKDSTNYWLIRINAGGDIILSEVVAGIGNVRATAVGVVTVAQRIVIIAEGTRIRVFTSTERIDYNSASNFQTETAGELADEGGGAVEDIVAWPRIITGSARAQLEAMIP